mmetsp:Transcript_26973/g.88512  ORF Transcript_26973/g.88512 Transcript_26973/m.88512 type:complete len:97 (-) Transcript_26973:138-428(-)
MPATTEMLENGETVEDITNRLLDGLSTGAGITSECTPQYGPCEPEALKTRMQRAVASLGREEIENLLESGETVDVTCEFCKESFSFGREAFEDALG